MRTLFALLILANLALYLWATQLSPKAELGLPEAQPGHNLEVMELVSEESIVIDARADCLRIGPFSTQQTLSEGRRILVNKGYVPYDAGSFENPGFKNMLEQQEALSQGRAYEIDLESKQVNRFNAEFLKATQSQKENSNLAHNH